MLAKVHVTTVSLALRGSPKIPASTRERITHLAQQLGYRRDPVQLALTARRANSRVPRHRPRIAFLTNRPTEATFFNTSHMRDFLSGAIRQSEAMGYRCDLVLCGGEKVSAQELQAQLIAAGTEGIILGAFMPFFRTIDLDWSRFAVVKIDSCFMPPNATLVTNDQASVIQLAFKHLHASGYRRVGMLVGVFDEESTNGLYASSYALAQDSLGCAYVSPLYIAHTDEKAVTISRLAKWVREQRVDAVVSNWSNILDLLHASGFRVPQEVGCACLSLHAPDPVVSGVIQNHYTVGQKAAEAVVLLLRRGQRGPSDHAPATYVEGTWNEGTTAPHRAERKVTASGV